MAGRADLHSLPVSTDRRDRAIDCTAAAATAATDYCAAC